MTVFYVNRTTNTSADTVLALGWAALLEEVCAQLGIVSRELLILQRNDSYEVTLSGELRLEQLIGEKRILFLDPLISVKQLEKQAKKGRVLKDGFYYEQQVEQQRLYLKQRTQWKPQFRRPEAIWGNDPELAAVLATRPKPELVHYQAINSLKAPDTFNEIVLSWRDLSVQQQWQVIQILFRLFSQQENDREAAKKAWNDLAENQHIKCHTTMTAVQVINPTTGKGANTLKSNRLNNDGLDSFWLLELLKFKGFLLGAAPYVLKTGKDSKPQKKEKAKKKLRDRKTYVIQPQKMEFHTLTRIMEEFRQICWSTTAVKQDVLAALRLAQVLVQHRRTELTSRQGLETWEEGPIVSMVRGFDVAFYKDMKTAHATMNVSTLNIPNWFPDVSTMQRVEEAESLLQEHIRVIRRIQNEKEKEGGEEFELLRTYRDFLSGHDLRPFWRFASLYGFYLFRQREHEKENVKLWLPQLTKKGLDYLVKQQQEQYFSEIINNRGFQHIATAIRESTVKAQRRHSQEKDTRYEIRYGLGQELLRKARYRDDFMIALNKFLILYNAETAREAEKAAKKQSAEKQPQTEKAPQPPDQNAKKPPAAKLRYPVSTADLAQLSILFDNHPVELVATMLISYGYCRWEPWPQHDEAALASLDDDLETDTEVDIDAEAEEDESDDAE